MSDFNEKTALIKRLVSENALLRANVREGQQAGQREQARTSRLLADSMQRIQTLQREIAHTRAQLRNTQNAQREHATGYLYRQKSELRVGQGIRAEPQVVSAEGAGDIEAGTDTNAAPLRILIADPYFVVREGLISLFSRQADMQIAGQAGSGREAYDHYNAIRPDTLVMETDLPDWKGDRLIAALSKRYVDCCILVFSHNAGDAAAESALRTGAKGHLCKNAPLEVIIAAVGA